MACNRKRSIVILVKSAYYSYTSVYTRRKNIIFMLKQKILNLLEFRLKTIDIVIGLAISLAIGATLGLGIHIYT